MKPNELSELFNLSERRKYDIIEHGVELDLSSEIGINEFCRFGTVVLVPKDDQDPDRFPTVDVAFITGYTVENGRPQFLVRNFADLSVSYAVTHAFPLCCTDRPVVLHIGRIGTPRTCRVIGYRVSDNCLVVSIVGDGDATIVAFPLEDFQTIKKDS